MAAASTTAVHCSLLQRVDDGDVQCSIATSRPVGEEDIGRASVIARKQKAALLHWVENSARRHLENMVSNVVVPGNAFSPESAAEGMVTKLVTGVMASRARPILTIHLASKAVLHGKEKLDGLED